jgi:hypothetical protein
MNKTSLLAMVAVGLVAGCARPRLEGGFEGTYDCGEDLRVGAALDEEDDGDVTGVVFAEVNLILLGTQYTRFEVDDGAYDAETNEYSFTLVDGDNTNRFDVNLEFVVDDADELKGEITERRTDDQAPAECDIDLTRVSLPGN